LNADNPSKGDLDGPRFKSTRLGEKPEEKPSNMMKTNGEQEDAQNGPNDAAKTDDEQAKTTMAEKTKQKSAMYNFIEKFIPSNEDLINGGLQARTSPNTNNLNRHQLM